MSWGNGAPRGWPLNFSIPADYLTESELPEFQPQRLNAGAFRPLSTNTNTDTEDIERTAGDDTVFNTIKFDHNTTDQWFVNTQPPIGWTGGKITFIPRYIILDDVGTPDTIQWNLGVESMADEHNIDAMSFQTISSADTPADVEPAFYIGPESSELTITGAAATSDLCLRISRQTGGESDAAYFVGLLLKFVQ